MGKWTGIAKDYPSLPIDPERSEVLDAAIAEYAAMPIDDRFDLYNQENETKKEANKRLKEINIKLEALTTSILRQMQQDNRDSLTTKGYKWTPSPEPYAKVLDRAELRAWAQEHMPDSLQMHPGTLESTMKTALETGDPLPDGIDVFIKWSLSRTKQ